MYVDEIRAYTPQNEQEAAEQPLPFRYSVRWTGQEKSAFSISKMTSSKEHWKQRRRLEKKNMLNFQMAAQATNLEPFKKVAETYTLWEDVVIY